MTVFSYLQDAQARAEGCPLGQSSCEPFRQAYSFAITYIDTGASPLSGGVLVRGGRYRVLHGRDGATAAWGDSLKRAWQTSLGPALIPDPSGRRGVGVSMVLIHF